MKEIIIYPSKAKLLLIAVGALLFVAGGIYFAIESESLNLSYWKIVLVSYIGVPFFGLCFIYAIYRLLKPQPSLVINREGIFDNASAVGAGLIRWQEIAELIPYSFMGQQFLGIVPVNVDEILARQSCIKRMVVKMNQALVQAPFNIPQNILPISIDELMYTIEGYSLSLDGDPDQYSASASDNSKK